MKHLKKRTSLHLELAEMQADTNRSVIETLRKMQQEMRALAAAQHAMERRHDQLALAFIRAATAVGGTPPGSEVARG